MSGAGVTTGVCIGGDVVLFGFGLTGVISRCSSVAKGLRRAFDTAFVTIAGPVRLRRQNAHGIR